MTGPLKQPTGKRWIRPLPERVVNKIAAGEVIERPSAVIKELVENAVDAGADRIDVIIEKSGIKSIKIGDNGCGIPEDQIEVAFSRHATSKIAAFDDLEALGSYGFRGEALPSVASVSRLRMVSRPPDEPSGTEIVIEGGVVQSRQPIAAPVGTSVEVENLFFNTPARRKFLKSEATETRHISRIVTALALGCHALGFSFKSNGRTIFTVPPGGTLGERVSALLGKGKRFIEVSGEMGPVAITGFVGAPDATINNRNGQYLFVNDRFIYSPSISHALTAGYGEMIPRGTFPVGALMLTVDGAEVDVNVHPSKTEVRLSREREIHESVRRLVRESLRQDGVIPAFHAGPQHGNDHVPSDSPHGDNNHTGGAIPGIHAPSSANAHFMSELYRPLPSSPLPEPAADGDDRVVVDRNTGEVLGPASGDVRPGTADGPSSGFRLVGRFSDLYLLLQAGDDLYIVDQHTAHERVLYEEMLSRIEEQSVHGQAMLFPVQVELEPEQLAVFGEIEDLLNASGFAVSGFGGRMVRIEATPSIMAKKPPEKMFLKVLDDFASLRKSGIDVKKAMAQSIACRSAVMSGDRLGDEEATHLLTRLLECENRYSCPHGRPTFIRITRSDLDRQFGRG